MASPTSMLPALPREPWLRAPRTSLRPFAFWIVLSAYFTLVYFASRTGVRVEGLLLVLLLGVPALIVLGAFVWTLRRQRALHRMNNEALSVLNGGELDRAAELFTQLARRSWRLPRLHLACLFNLSVAELRRGRTGKALALLAALERYPGHRELGFETACYLAIAYAVEGDPAASERWLDRARRRKRQIVSELDSFAEAFVHCRRGRWSEWPERFLGRWSALEAGLPGDLLRTLRVLVGFALARGGASLPILENMLAGARPVRPDEYAYLGQRWPELEGFLLERRLLELPSKDA
jgi:hypothetical protein